MNSKIIALLVGFSFSFFNLCGYCDGATRFLYQSQANSSFKVIPLKERILTLLHQNRFSPYMQIGEFHFGGFAHFDIKPKTMQKTLPGEDENYFALSNLGASIKINLTSFLQFDSTVAYYKSNKGQGDSSKNTGLLLDEGYVTFGNLLNGSFLIQAGQMYLPFGMYDKFVIASSLVQMLTEIRANALQIGFTKFNEKDGFIALAFISQGELTKNPNKIQGDINSGIGFFGTHQFYKNFSFGIGFQYIYNMLNVNALRQGGNFQLSRRNVNNVYIDRVPGIALQAYANLAEQYLFIKYASGLKSSRDLTRLRINPKDPNTGILNAKPSAWEAGIVLNKLLPKAPQISFDFSYQRSRETAGLFVFNALPSQTHPFPEIRYIIGVEYALYKNAYIRLQWGHNYLYKIGKGDDGRQGDDATIRLGMFV